jgi:hypothetical protein
MRATEYADCWRCGGEIEPGNLINPAFDAPPDSEAIQHEDCVGEDDD